MYRIETGLKKSWSWQENSYKRVRMILLKSSIRRCTREYFSLVQRRQFTTLAEGVRTFLVSRAPNRARLVKRAPNRARLVKRPQTGLILTSGPQKLCAGIMRNHQIHFLLADLQMGSFSLVCPQPGSFSRVGPHSGSFSLAGPLTVSFSLVDPRLDWLISSSGTSYWLI